MLNLYFLTFVLIFLSFSGNKHSLCSLLSLELLCLLLVSLCFLMGLDCFYSIMLICVSACGGAIGLSLLVSLSRLGSVDA